MCRVCEHVPGVSLGNYQLTDLEYADNTIMLSTSNSLLKDALMVYNEEAEKLVLYVNWTKTKFMHVVEGPDPPTILLGNNTIEAEKELCVSGVRGDRKRRP